MYIASPTSHHPHLPTHSVSYLSSPTHLLPCPTHITCYSDVSGETDLCASSIPSNATMHGMGRFPNSPKMRHPLATRGPTSSGLIVARSLRSAPAQKMPGTALLRMTTRKSLLYLTASMYSENNERESNVLNVYETALPVEPHSCLEHFLQWVC